MTMKKLILQLFKTRHFQKTTKPLSYFNIRIKNITPNHLLSIVNARVEGKEFNKTTGVLELSFSDIAYIGCTFKEIEFKNIRFSNVFFENCVFHLCKFQRCNIGHESFLEIFGGNIERTSFYKCNLSGIIMKRCKLNVTSFKDTFMARCNLIGNSYNAVRFIDDCNLMECVIKDTSCSMDILFLNQRGYTRVSYGSYIGPFNYKDNYYCLRNKSTHPCSKKDLNIANSYMAFGNQYLKNDIQDKYGECFYESKKAKHRTLRGIKKIVSTLSNFVCGYGEKPYRSFGISLLIILFCAVIYLFTGIETKTGVIDYHDLSMPKGVLVFLKDFLYSIHFSIVTFCTVGYGNLVPHSMISMFVANLEIIAGVIMVAIWTSTLVRKMTR